MEEARDLRKSEPVSDDVIELVQLLQSGLCQRLEHRLGALAHVRMKVRPVGLKTTTLSESFSDLLQSLLFFHDSNSPFVMLFNLASSIIIEKFEKNVKSFVF